MALADAHLRSGDAEQALQLAAEVEALDAPAALPERAEAAMIRGQAAWALHRTDEAVEAYQVAIDLLTECGEDRYTAQLWYDLAELLDQVGNDRPCHHRAPHGSQGKRPAIGSTDSTRAKPNTADTTIASRPLDHCRRNCWRL